MSRFRGGHILYRFFLLKRTHCIITLKLKCLILNALYTLTVESKSVVQNILFLINLIARPIHAPTHELQDTDINTPPTKVIIKRILVELLGIREESFIIYL